MIIVYKPVHKPNKKKNVHQVGILANCALLDDRYVAIAWALQSFSQKSPRRSKCDFTSKFCLVFFFLNAMLVIYSKHLADY